MLGAKAIVEKYLLVLLDPFIHDDFVKSHPCIGLVKFYESSKLFLINVANILRDSTGQAHVSLLLNSLNTPYDKLTKHPVS
jgi:hypothetical protein